MSSLHSAFSPYLTEIERLLLEALLTISAAPWHPGRVVVPRQAHVRRFVLVGQILVAHCVCKKKL